MESQPPFTGEGFSTEKDSRKVQGPTRTDGTSRLWPLYLHFRVRACALRYVPGTSGDEKKTTNKLEIASKFAKNNKEEKEKTGEILRRFR